MQSIQNWFKLLQSWIKGSSLYNSLFMQFEPIYIYNKFIIIFLIKDFKIMETGKIFFIYDNSHYSNLLVIDNNIDKSIKHFTFRTIKDEFKNKTFIFRISNSFNNVFHSKLSTNLVIVTTRSEQFFIR